MISSTPVSRCFLFLLVLIFSIPHESIGQTSSTCPNNKNASCTALPFNISNPPDVWLHVPNLSVDEISLVVENVKAQVSISTNVANLVSLNAGVDVSIDKVNLTILGVKAQVELAVYLDNVAKIVTRTVSSLDLNPLLTSLVTGVLDTVSNLLGTLTQDGKLIHQIINSVGQIVNQILGPAGELLSSEIVGNYSQNMTYTGVSQALDNGNIVKQYSYPPPIGSTQTSNTLVNIVFDVLGKVLGATVVSPTSTSTSTSTSTPTTTTVATTLASSPAPVITTTTAAAPPAV